MKCCSLMVTDSDCIILPTNMRDRTQVTTTTMLREKRRRATSTTNDDAVRKDETKRRERRRRKDEKSKTKEIRRIKKIPEVHHRREADKGRHRLSSASIGHIACVADCLCCACLVYRPCRSYCFCKNWRQLLVNDENAWLELGQSPIRTSSRPAVYAFHWLIFKKDGDRTNRRQLRF